MLPTPHHLLFETLTYHTTDFSRPQFLPAPEEHEPHLGEDQHSGHVHSVHDADHAQGFLDDDGDDGGDGDDAWGSGQCEADGGEGHGGDDQMREGGWRRLHHYQGKPLSWLDCADQMLQGCYWRILV